MNKPVSTSEELMAENARLLARVEAAELALSKCQTLGMPANGYSPTHQTSRSKELIRQCVAAIDACCDMDAALACLLQKAVEITGLDGGGVYVIQGQEALLKHHYHLPPEFVALVSCRPVKTGYVQYAIDHPQEVFDVKRLFPEHHKIGAEFGLKQVFCVGLYREGRLFGYLNLVSMREAQYEPIDLEALRILALEAEAAFVRLGAEHQLRAILSALTEGVAVMRSDGRIIEYNPSAERILGWNCDEINQRIFLGMGWDTIREDGRPFPFEDYPALVSLRTGQACREVTMGLRFKDGNLRWIRVNAEPLFDEGQLHPYAVVTSFSDITARKQVQTALVESEARYRKVVVEQAKLIVELKQVEAARWEALSRLEKLAGHVPGLVYQYRLFPDGRACIPFANGAIVGFFQVSPEEVRDDASKVFKVVHPEDRAGLVTSILQSAHELTPWNHEFRVELLDGSVHWLLGSSLPEREAEGSVLWHGFITDITVRKATESALRASVAEKTVLLKEVHHRVKNNLQIVSSLLDLQEGQICDARLTEILASTRNRVRSMSLIHEKLYQSNNLARLNLYVYLENLCRQMVDSAGSVRNRVQIQCLVEPKTMEFGLDQAVPCGLLINELVSNAFKHAFPGLSSGSIRVTLQQLEPASVLLRVADDGVGLPNSLDPSQTHSLGLQLVVLLTEQLHGSVTFEKGSGTAVQIRFPIPTATNL